MDTIIHMAYTSHTHLNTILQSIVHHLGTHTIQNKFTLNQYTHSLLCHLTSHLWLQENQSKITQLMKGTITQVVGHSPYLRTYHQVHDEATQLVHLFFYPLVPPSFTVRVQFLL